MAKLPKLVKLRPEHLSPKAWEAYNADGLFYFKATDGKYWVAETKAGKNAACVGSNIDDLNLFLEQRWALLQKEA